MQWTDERKTYLFTARRRGKTTAQIAVTMSDWYAEEITEAQLDDLWADMLESGWVKRKRSQLDAFRKKHVFAGEDPAAEKRRLVNANILHLVDLKRAGHSPRKIRWDRQTGAVVSAPGATELDIAIEGHGVRYRTADTCSYIGSSAASCAAEV